ncbi:MAG: alpha-hydroxy acid oxidase [Mycobacteriales bacterium]
MLDHLLDVRDLAAAALPAAVSEYFACGAGDETATNEAEAAWRDFRVRPRVLAGSGPVDVTTDLLGCRLQSPIGVAPTAFHTLAHPDGERATAAGAAGVGALTVVSTRASQLLEDIAAQTAAHSAGPSAAPWWFQVYPLGHRDVTQRLVERAVAAGAGALVLTGDTPVVGRKRQLAGTRLPGVDLLVNLRPDMAPGADLADLERAAEQDPAAGLEQIDWLRRISGLSVLVKGVLRGDDAVRCLDAGAAGVVVSNHGGRQSPRAVAAAHALPEVVAAVAGRGPVLVDGGIRSGSDALVALALGAAAVLVGRPVLWGLAAAGANGVRGILTALTEDLVHQMALLGAPTVRALQPTDVLRVR